MKDISPSGLVWEKRLSSEVFDDFTPVRNPSWLWPRYGRVYDPAIWVPVSRTDTDSGEPSRPGSSRT